MLGGFGFAVRFDASAELFPGVIAAAIRCRNCVAETNTCCQEKLPAALIDRRQMPIPQRAAFRLDLRNGCPSSDLVIVGWSSLSRLPFHLGGCRRVCVSATAASAICVLVACGSVGVSRCGRSCLQQRSLINTRSSKNGHDHHSDYNRRHCCLFIWRRPRRRRSSARALRLSSPMPLSSIAFSSELPLLRDNSAAADFHHGVEQRLAIHLARMGPPRHRRAIY